MLAGDITQVEQRHQGEGVGLLGVEAFRVAEDDHVLMGWDTYCIQQPATGGVALPVDDPLVAYEGGVIPPPCRIQGKRAVLSDLRQWIVRLLSG